MVPTFNDNIMQVTLKNIFKVKVTMSIRSAMATLGGFSNTFVYQNMPYKPENMSFYDKFKQMTLKNVFKVKVTRSIRCAMATLGGVSNTFAYRGYIKHSLTMKEIQEYCVGHRCNWFCVWRWFAGWGVSEENLGKPIFTVCLKFHKERVGVGGNAVRRSMLQLLFRSKKSEALIGRWGGSRWWYPWETPISMLSARNDFEK